MAEEAKEPATAPEPAKRKLPVKTLGALAAVLLLEAGAISAAFLFAGGPAPVKAEGAPEDAAALLEQPVETLVVADKFQNTRTGRSYMYDTEIFVVVTTKNQSNVEGRVDQMKAQITTDIATIFRRAEPSHLLEPELSTLTRQVRAALDERLGIDEDGQPYVREVLIKKCTQFRADL